MPQIIRVQAPSQGKHRLCTGAPFAGPGLVWDSFDHLAHRVANSARQLFGYTPTEDVRPDPAVAPAKFRSEGIMKSYVYFNNNGHEEMKQIESHCKDGTCVQRTRSFAPHHGEAHAVHRSIPKVAQDHAGQAAATSPRSLPKVMPHASLQAATVGRLQPYEA
mmetsp:Transcript_24025/g.42486  ORF Transcript_24025/g.42486 Transcript_24025/m.42486 type:complete len:162 (-) Transcript_24025:37-522(-)